MRVLGIDTSSHAGSLAVMHDGLLLGSVNSWSPTTHSVRLLPSLDGLLRQLGMGIEAIDVVAVGTGPGSFTGIRIGLATAKALCFALGRPIVGVSNLEALASSALSLERVLVPVIEAGRNEVYRAVFSTDSEGRLVRLRPDELAKPEEAFTEGIRGGAVFVGQAALRYRAVIESLRPYDVPIFKGGSFLAEEIARLGFEAAMRKEIGDPVVLEADYIRRSDAEIKSGRADVRCSRPV